MGTRLAAVPAADAKIARTTTLEGGSVEHPLPKAGKAFIIIFGVLAALVIAITAAANIYMRTAYSQFYDTARPEFAQPGLDEGFIPQDLDYFDTAGGWLFSGYMSDGSASPLYRQCEDGSFAKLLVALPDGSIYDGHGSGVTSTDNHVLLTCEGGYLILDAPAVAAATDGATVEVLAKRDLDFSPAFMNIENGTLYTGNFYFPEAYETPAEHRILAADGTENPAVLYAYAADDSDPYGFSSQAERVYSIPGKVQGVCFTEEGRIVLSTSYGLAGSRILVYDEALVQPLGLFPADGNEVPLLSLDSSSLVETVEAPPMTEGIESHLGRIYIANESACNKYIFGKLYNGSEVYSLKL